MTHASRQRPIFLLIGATLCALFLLFGLLIFPEESRTAALLFDLAGKIGAYPLTVQGLMWLMFFLALSDGLFLYVTTEDEKSYLKKKLLPEETSKMISPETATTIYRSISGQPRSDKAIPFLIQKTLDQFFIAHSISRANEVFDSSIRILVEKNELKLTFIKYVAWLLPTIGFIGTVIGISLALVVAAEPPIEMDSLSMRAWMSSLTGELGFAFDTTLLALAQSAVIVFLQTKLQSHGDQVLLDCEEYCLDNLINKLLEP